ncbi:MAG: hypothetical protein Q9182_000932 [Xanthomendoza sp. 2 TL-2023]
MAMLKAQGRTSIRPFFLPKVEPWLLNTCCYPLTNDDSTLDHIRGCPGFDIDTLAWAIQNGLSTNCIDRYLKGWNAAKIKEALCTPVTSSFNERLHNCPILFFAIERNCPTLVRLRCQAGADPGQPAQPPKLPVLAYCIMTAEYDLSDTTDTLSALLAMGADPYDLPQDMWYDFIKNPTKVGTSEADRAKYDWCSLEVRGALCKTFNLLQRYQFKVASLLPTKTARQKQVAAAFDMTPLFEIPFQIVGQRLATETVQKWVMNHTLHHRQLPLVLLFTGPSGHGKTELAQRMGELLSMPFLKVDCTQALHTADLLGPQAPYEGHKAGSSLNNFLATHSGKKAVVFLDEFEKTSGEVHQSLLLLFDQGYYQDRREVGKQIDCTKIIWVLASNQGEEIIQKHWDDHLADLPEDSPLQHQLEQNFQHRFGAPLTGRLSAIIPFLPFRKEERAVVTYTFMRTLVNESRQPVSVEANQLARHLFLNFVDEGQLASFIAEKYYCAELGARSLLKAVNTQISHKVTNAFLMQDEEIKDEVNNKPWSNYDVRIQDRKVGLKEITVQVKGSRTVQKRINDKDEPVSP